MKVEHKLGPAWAAHFEQMVGEINAHEAKAFELEGRAQAERRAADLKLQHVRQSIQTIVDAEKLPKSQTPYALVGDKLIGEIQDAAKA